MFSQPTFCSSRLSVIGGALLLVLLNGCGNVRTAPAENSALGLDTKISRGNDQVEIISKVYHIDKIYPSMTGPWSLVKVPLLDMPQPELVWITGTEVEMLDRDGKQRMSDEFMCHANLDFNGEKHCQQVGLKKYLDGRLFTLSQGQLGVRFPQGTGIPIRSDYPLELVTQALNLNIKDANFDVRHRVTIHFIRDQDVQGKMTPLYESGVSSQITLEDRPLAFGVLDYGTGSKMMGMCMPGEKAKNGVVQEDRYGQRFTAHWMVPPGRQVSRTRCTAIMNVPTDTKIYAIAVHMHPYAESLELRDVTENRAIFRSYARNFSDKVGLDSVDSLTSKDGIPIFKHHEYEMVCTYNNTTNENVDSMAVMYLYLEDQEFDRAEAKKRIAADPQLMEILATGSSEKERPKM